VQIQVNMDVHVKGNERLTHHASGLVEAALNRFGDRLTRVEVHLSEQKSHHSPGEDERCLLEARLAGHQPIAVRHRAGTMEQAIDGAVERLKRLLDDTIAQLDGHRGDGADHA
jgi:ribosome-associated translation inhibitor RaiA